MTFIVADRRQATHQAIIRYQRELPFSQLPDGSFEIEEDFTEVYFSGFPSENHMDSLVPDGWDVIDQRVMVVDQGSYRHDDELFWGTPGPLTEIMEELVEDYA